MFTLQSGQRHIGVVSILAFEIYKVSTVLLIFSSGQKFVYAKAL
jgi:hypothetical protein